MIAEFNILEGKILKEIINRDYKYLIFKAEDEVFHMHHYQDCCENVVIDDICGDLNDLLDTPIISAYESVNRENPRSEYDDSFTWTFYHISTIKGSVTIKWYGCSNGYYSETVEFETQKIF